LPAKGKPACFSSGSSRNWKMVSAAAKPRCSACEMPVMRLIGANSSIMAVRKDMKSPALKPPCCARSAAKYRMAANAQAIISWVTPVLAELAALCLTWLRRNASAAS
jgi:hypothetical protein